GRYRTLPHDLVRKAGLLLDEPGHVARLPIPLQLVRQADLGSALSRALAENVAAELGWLKRTFRPDHVWFVDDIFGLIPGWMERFADLVEQQDARLPFKSLQRVDLILKGDTIDALRRAGAERIWVGAESGSQKILDAMEKGTQVENIYEAARRLHAAGIQVGFFLQFGYPGETRQDIERTLQMVRD